MKYKFPTIEDGLCAVCVSSAFCVCLLFLLFIAVLTRFKPNNKTKTIILSVLIKEITYIHSSLQSRRFVGALKLIIHSIFPSTVSVFSFIASHPLHATPIRSHVIMLYVTVPLFLDSWSLHQCSIQSTS